MQKPGALKVVEATLWFTAAALGVGFVAILMTDALGPAAGCVVVMGFYLLMAMALRRGSEGARSLLLVLGSVSLAGNVVVFAFVLVLLGDKGPLPPILGLLVGTGWGLLQAGFTIWTLKRADVQQWMFQRTMGEDSD